MNWDAIGAIGEILGATAVVISLVYVAVQIRQNTNETRMQRTQSLIAANADVNSQVAGDKELADVFQAAVVDFDALSGSEKIRFGGLVFSTFNRYSFAYYQYLRGDLEEVFWKVIEQEMAVFLTLPGARTWWERDKSRFIPEFVAHLDKLVGQQNAGDRNLSFTEPPT